MNCHQEMLEHLHENYKIDVNERGHNRRTAMHLAARYGRVRSNESDEGVSNTALNANFETYQSQEDRTWKTVKYLIDATSSQIG